MGVDRLMNLKKGTAGYRRILEYTSWAEGEPNTLEVWSIMLILILIQEIGAMLPMMHLI